MENTEMPDELLASMLEAAAAYLRSGAFMESRCLAQEARVERVRAAWYLAQVVQECEARGL